MTDASTAAASPDTGNRWVITQQTASWINFDISNNGTADATLAKTPGPATPVISPAGTQTTNGSSVATFTVSSGTAGTNEFTGSPAPARLPETTW